jgi:cysteine desulfurase / selenocysteine lyase
MNPFRKDFPALGRRIDGQQIVYLDNAATTVKPQTVIDAVMNHYTYNGSNIHRGHHRLSEEASDAYEASRMAMASYIGAAANEVVFTRNTTEALNLVASGLRLPTDSYIVGSLDAHHSQILPWRRAGRLELTRVDEHGLVDREHFRDLLKKQPAVVALCHCSNVTGAVHPVQDMIGEIRDACNAIIVLDAAQSMPHMRINLAELDVDFMAFSPHKMLCPTGVGILFGRSELLNRLEPLVVGGGMVDWVDAETVVMRRIPHKFEAGTPAIAAVIGCANALAYLRNTDSLDRYSIEEENCAALLKGALERPYLRLIGPQTTRSRIAIATLSLGERVPVGEVAQLLSDSYGFMVRSGHMCAQLLVGKLAGAETLRISAYIYNDKTEIESFYYALDEIMRYMGLPA